MKNFQNFDAVRMICTWNALPQLSIAKIILKSPVVLQLTILRKRKYMNSKSGSKLKNGTGGKIIWNYLKLFCNEYNDGSFVYKFEDEYKRKFIDLIITISIMTTGNG